MGLALEEARAGLAAGEVPVGAVLVGEGGEILARAFNRPIGLCRPHRARRDFGRAGRGAAFGELPVAGLKPLCYH